MAALDFRPLLEIAQTLRQRRTSAQELVEAAIARHGAFGDRLQAYSQWAPERALASARAADAALAAATVGPLHGVPISIKDLFAAEGFACFLGLDAWGDQVTAAGFAELNLCYGPPRLPRQPWLAPVWRKA